MNCKITQKRLKELLYYDLKTGIFTWRVSPNNRIPKGKEASCISQTGYITICIDRSQYLAHRLAWLYVYGNFPENIIDHINRNRLDNRIENLRDVSYTCNSRNRKKYKNNKSGVSGVSFNVDKLKWHSFIRINNKQVNLGYHKDYNEAVSIRWKAEKKYGWPNCNTISPAYLYLKENNLLTGNQNNLRD